MPKESRLNDAPLSLRQKLRRVPAALAKARMGTRGVLTSRRQVPRPWGWTHRGRRTRPATWCRSPTRRNIGPTNWVSLGCVAEYGMTALPRARSCHFWLSHNGISSQWKLMWLATRGMWHFDTWPAGSQINCPWVFKLKYHEAMWFGAKKGTRTQWQPRRGSRGCRRSTLQLPLRIWFRRSLVELNMWHVSAPRMRRRSRRQGRIALLLCGELTEVRDNSTSGVADLWIRARWLLC